MAIVAMNMIKRTSYFSGNVQGVGFRYTAQQVARSFNVTGTVRNLDDGRVELVAEGEQKEIQAFLAAIEQKMQGNIRERTDDDAPATGRFPDFRVTR
jgi:acylphosphatase